MWWPFSSAEEEQQQQKKKSPPKKKIEPKKKAKPEPVSDGKPKIKKADGVVPRPLKKKANDGVVFTSNKCPPKPDLDNNFRDIPYGFIWTPQAENEKVQVIDCVSQAMLPVICLTCLAYINPHSQVDFETGVWTCALCEQKNVAPIPDLKNLIRPALENNMVEYHQDLPSKPTAKVDDVVSDNHSVSSRSVGSRSESHRSYVSGESHGSYDEDAASRGSYHHDDEGSHKSYESGGSRKSYESGGSRRSYVSENRSYSSRSSHVDDDYNDDTRTLVLVVDTNLTGNDGRGILNAVEEFVKVIERDFEDYPRTRIGLVVFDQVVCMYQLGLLGIASADVYTPIDPDDDEALVARKKSMEERAYLHEVQSLEDLDSLIQCLSATFGVPVDEKEQQGEEPPESRMEMLKRKKEDRLRKEKKGKEEKASSSKASPWIKRRENSKTKHPKRCVGEAIQCAIDLTVVGHPEPSRTSQILLFTNGCPNVGGGSVVADENKENEGPAHAHDLVDIEKLQKAIDYFDTTASFALDTGVGIDVFCSGVTELAIPAYQALVEPSGGYVMSHTSLASKQLKQNFNWVLQNTYTSRSPAVDSDDTTTNDSQMFLDIRTDSFMTPSTLNGPGELIAEDADMLETERKGYEEGVELAVEEGFETKDLPLADALDVSMTRIKLGRVDPLSTISVLLELNETFEEENDTHCFFQFISRHVDRKGQRFITRVYTYRFPVAKDTTDFIENANSDVVAVVLAKTAVYRTLHGREETEEVRDKVTAGDTETLEKLANETQLDIDATVQRISGSFRLLGLEKKGKGKKPKSSSSLDSAFPPNLNGALRLLYHLRRGPLISPGPMRSMDDRAALRGFFLRFPLEDCLSMMAPQLFSTGYIEGEEYIAEELLDLPAETLSLWDYSIVAADHYDFLYIWSGKGCTGEDYEEIRKHCRRYVWRRAKTRFPMPEVEMLNEGDSMSRRFTAELAPSHADSEERQIASFPQLATLPRKALQSLRSRIKFYDKNADASFHTWFWNVSSATNVSKEEGMSLCD
mmetsp:Transcript_31582/g.76274  ORF Transcript_31582/g.76274 Transcript_31582/m.76274 type:complete len:1031 (+) Transcript_31582:58-3150(+)|eukprot:CAMPEP_0113637560 /NCGR_PEP_ID=MMETSP0017_2-20120614/19667_1 /TAXON_ID=2856 /ORGANISM="Cylindrotheca closterium" /LENGTH=1030 /DNA_ID=CAMNT_0000548607 /DNA_START=17 /DNA_END=3109 /DNA_ORIENTATION=+ /assembly_acc=CAM_ASM_000147